MTDVNASININIDTSRAQSELQSLQTRISAFNKSLSSTSVVQAAQTKALMDGINASQMFQARLIPVVSGVDQFTNSLEKNKLSLGEYTRYATSQLPGMSKVFRREFDMMERVARDRVKRINTQYLALGRSAKGVQEAMAITPTGLASGFGTEMAVASQKAQIFNKLIDDGSTKMLNWGKNTQWAGRQLMVGFSLPLAALGTIAAQTFMELDRATLSLERVYGDLSTTTEEVERNSAAIKDLGSEYTKYGIAVKDTIAVAARAAATGATNQTLVAATEQTLRFATLGQIDYNQALDTTISLQTAFGVSNDELASKIDYLNAVENQTILTMDDMSLAIPRVATVVQGLGGSVEDLAVFMTAMREGGVSAENAANGLKSGLASLINPTDRASASLQGMGIDLQGMIETNRGDLMGLVTDFGKALNSIDSFSRQQVLEQVFGKYQYARMSALFTNIASSSGQAARAMELAGMSASELASIADRELGKIEESTTVKFTAAMEQLKLSIAPLGEAFLKGIMPIVEGVTKIAEIFNNLPDPVKNAFAVITGVVAGLGPIFLMTIGLIGNGVANLIKGIQFLRRTIARVKGDSESFEYMAIAELEAKNASEILDGSVRGLTGSLHLQSAAVSTLIRQYERYAIVAGGTAGSVAGAGKRAGAPPRRMANGGVVPGTGSGDKIPALLEPGETVITKKASQKYGPVIAAMNAGNLPGYVEGKDSGVPISSIAGLNLPEGSKVRRGVDTQSLEDVISVSRRAANAIEDQTEKTKKLTEIDDAVISLFGRENSARKKATVNASSLAKALGEVIPPLKETSETLSAAHLTSRKALSQEGKDWLATRTGQGEGGKSIPAQKLLKLSEDPLMAPYIQQFSGLTAGLSQDLNNLLKNEKTGAQISDFNKEWSREGSRLLPSLKKFGDFAGDNAEDLKALSKFERLLSIRINSRSDVIETGIITDKILEAETRDLIQDMKVAGGSMAKVAIAAETASNTVAQVGVSMSKAEAQSRATGKNPTVRIEGRDDPNSKDLRYFDIASGAVLGRESKESGTWRPERYGDLAKETRPKVARASQTSGKIIGEESLKATRAVHKSKSPAEEYAKVMDDAAAGTLVGAKRSSSVASKAGKIVGQSAKDAYKQEMSQLRRDVRNVDVMEQGGMKDATMQTRTLRRLEESKARSRQAEIAEQKRLERLAEQSARQARIKNIAETAIIGARTAEIKEQTRMQRMQARAGGIAQGIEGKAGMIGMGLGMASMVPFMAQNEEGKFAGMDANALGMGMGAAGMAFDVVGMANLAGRGGILGKIATGFATMAGPLAIATAAIGAVGIGMYLWRKNVDESSKKAAEFGANIGGASNALNNMAQMLGKETPAQRAAQVKLGVTQEQSEGISQWTATFESGAGKQFIDDLTSATSEERFKKLSDYIKYAIASGMMDAAQGEEFANAVALKLGDTILGMRAKTATAGQAVGTQALLGLAATRAAEVKATEAYTQVGIVRGNKTDQFESTEATNADTVISGSLQVIQDYANASALASEELAAGKISQQVYQDAVSKSNEAISRATFDMTEAMYASDDLGGSMQGLKDQLAKAGVSAENAEYIAGINQKEVRGGGARVTVTGGTTQQLRAEAASAAMQGMDVESIKSITEYMQGTAGTAVSETFKKVAGSERGKGQAYGLAATQMSLEQGALGALDAKQIEKVMQVSINYVESGGTAAEIQQFLMTLPPSVVTNVITKFSAVGADGKPLMTPEEQKQYIDSYNKMLPAVGSETAYKVTEATGGNVEQGAVDAANQLKQIFGSDQETINKYINLALTTSPKDFNKELPKLTDQIQLINEQIPQDIQKYIGIDLTNPEDVAKYGPLAKDINLLVPAINSLPEGQKEIATSFIFTKNGKDIQDPIKFARDIVKMQKTMAGLSSDKMKVRKESAIELIMQMYDKDGNAIDENQAKTYMQDIIQDLGISEAEFLQLPPDTISKVFAIRVALDMKKEDLAAAQAYYDFAVKTGNARQADEAFVVLQAAKKALAAAKKSAGAETASAVAAGMVQGGNEISKSGGDGGGGGEKSLLKEMQGNLKLLTDQYDAIKRLVKGKNKDFKGMMAGPFAPEFIQYLKDQGEKGVKLLKEGGAKFNQAYRVWVKTQLQEGKNAQQMMATIFRTQAAESAGKGRAQTRFAAAGWNPETTEQYFSQLPQGTFAAAEKARKQREDLIGKRFGKNFNKVKDYEDLSKKQKARIDKLMSDEDKLAISLTTPSKKTTKQAMTAQYRGAQDQIRPEMLAAQNIQNLSSLKIPGLTPEIAQRLNDIGVTANMSKDQISSLIKELNLLSQMEWDAKPITERTSEMLSAQQSILDIQRQIEELDRLKPEQDLLETMQKANEELGRTIELRNRELEPIDEAISKLEEEKNKINEIYDTRLKALEEIEQVNERIRQQQQAQLSIAQALSVGDVAGAAKAMQDLQQQMAQGREQETKDALENARASQLAAIDQKINGLKAQRKVIEDQIKVLQNQQRVNADAIYAKQKLINTIQDSISKKYDDQKLKLAALNNELVIAQQNWQEILRLMGLAGSTPAGTVLAVPQPQQTQNEETSPWGTPVVTDSQGDRYTTLPGFGITVPLAKGGMVPRYLAKGGMSVGTDTVPAMLTPGEFVMRKASVDKFGSSMFQSLNSGVLPRFNVPAESSYGLSKPDASNSSAVYNYDVSVNVAGTNASPDEIANVVMSKIKMADGRKIRSYNY